MILDHFFIKVKLFNARLVLGLGLSLGFEIGTPNCIVCFEVGKSLHGDDYWLGFGSCCCVHQLSFEDIEGFTGGYVK